MTLAVMAELMRDQVGGMPSPDSGEVQRVVPWPFEDGRFPSDLGAVVSGRY
jgi:hypothetical protein